LDPRFGAVEKCVGWPPFTLVVFVIGAAAGYLRLRRLRKRGAHVPPHDFLVPVLGLSATLLWLVSIKVGEHSLWWLAFKLIPGGSAIRVPVRINFVLTVILIIVVACSLESFLRNYRGRRGQVLLFLCSGFLLAEQL